MRTAFPCPPMARSSPSLVHPERQHLVGCDPERGRRVGRRRHTSHFGNEKIEKLAVSATGGGWRTTRTETVRRTSGRCRSPVERRAGDQRAEQQVRERLVAGRTRDRLSHHARRRSAGRIRGLRGRYEDRGRGEQRWRRATLLVGSGRQHNHLRFFEATRRQDSIADQRLGGLHRHSCAPGAPWGPPRGSRLTAALRSEMSPNGRLIAYTVPGQLRVIAPDGTAGRCSRLHEEADSASASLSHLV